MGTHSTVRRSRQVFDPRIAQVSGARRFVRETLTEWQLGSDDAELIVSELAANAVVHAASPFEVALEHDGDHLLRIEVSDTSCSAPVLSSAAVDAPSGRGLLIVSRLASGWGVLEQRHGEGKVIWAELPT